MKQKSDERAPALDGGDHGTSDDSAGDWADLLDPRRALILAMLCIGVALYAFNGFLVSTALPTAVRELGGAALLSWSLSLYLAGSIISGACAALLKQRFGARLVLIGAALAFLAGTLVAATALDMPTVLVGRLLQGLGEGIVAAVCYSLIPELFPPHLVPKVFGIEAGVWALAAFGGPVAAGLLTEQVSWRAAFYVNVPIVLLFIAMAAMIAPRRGAVESRLPLALPGLRLGLLTLGLSAIMISSVAGSVMISALLTLSAAILFGALVMVDRKAAVTILPRQAFRLGTTLGLGLWVVLLTSLAQATSSVYLVFALQNLWGFSATLAGGIGALMAVAWSLSAIGIAHLRLPALRYITMWAGPLLQASGLAAVLAGIASGQIAAILVGQVLVGTGFGISWAFLSQTMMAASPDGERDKTSALLPTLQSAGYAIGAAIAGLAANAAGLAGASAGEMVRGPLIAAFSLAVLLAVPAVLAGYRATRPAMIAKAGLERNLPS